MSVGDSWRENAVGITYALNRRAGDLKPGLGAPDRIALGKGEIDCGKRKIFIWQMAMQVTNRDVQALLPVDEACKEPDNWKPGEAVIACARRD